MAKEEIGGVWRTVGGRRIFIKDGEDLETAMKNSGKFGNKEEDLIFSEKEKYKKVELDIERTKDYATATERKYFKMARDFAVDNDMTLIKVGRIGYEFDFENMEVKIGKIKSDNELHDWSKHKMKFGK